MAGYGGGYPNSFWCWFDNEGYIVAQDLTGFKRIGVGLQKYNQAEKIANDATEKAAKYYQMCLEHDLIPKEISPEERLATLSTQVDTLTKLVEQQAQMIGALTNKVQEKPKAVEPEILQPAYTGENLNDQFVSRSAGGQVLISR